METNIVNSPRRLVRGNGPIAGVAGGLGDYFGVDPTLIRLGLVLTGVLTFPAIPVAYVAAWLIIPKHDAVESTVPAPAPQPMAPGSFPAPPPPPPVPNAPAPNPWAAPGASVVTTTTVETTEPVEADASEPVEADAGDTAEATEPVGAETETETEDKDKDS